MIINELEYKNPLLVFALESEADKYFEAFNTVFVGVGKVNAAYHLMKAIQSYKPDLIINLGTAGSTKFDRGTVICCAEFIQRDMEVMALGFEKFETPFSGEPIILKYGIQADHLPAGICGSGDQFETNHINIEYDVIDMEGYALAKVSQLENIPFLCLKYISDDADGNAVTDWSSEVKKAAKLLRASLF